jgi:hypothetical protein
MNTTDAVTNLKEIADSPRPSLANRWRDWTSERRDVAGVYRGEHIELEIGPGEWVAALVFDVKPGYVDIIFDDDSMMQVWRPEQFRDGTIKWRRPTTNDISVLTGGRLDVQGGGDAVPGVASFGHNGDT